MVVCIAVIPVLIKEDPKLLNSKLQTARFVDSGKEDNILYDEYWVLGSEINEDNVFNETLYDFSNSWVNKQIFKELIISNSSYSDYEKAINEFNVYQADLVDYCYCLNNHVLAIKGNKVFKGDLTDINLLDKILFLI